MTYTDVTCKKKKTNEEQIQNFTTIEEDEITFTFMVDDTLKFIYSINKFLYETYEG
jgi:hypothetical protein